MKIALSLFALALVVLAGWWFNKAPDYTNYPPRDGPIVAFGDSLVAGVGVSEDKNFVSLVSARLGEDIINLGVSGNTTADALARIDEVVALHPRIVLVLLGGNDYLRRIPTAQTFRNLSDIVDRLQQDGALVVLLGVRGGLLADNFAPEFKKLAQQKHTPLIPNVLDGLIGHEERMFDNIHPNEAGHAIIAERVYKTLSPL